MARYAHTKKDVPEGQHYAIMDFGSITIPGDERSRTHPGHGYPESTQYTVNYLVYETREEWEAEIKARMNAATVYGAKNFAAMICIPAKIETQVTVNVTTEQE